MPDITTPILPTLRNGGILKLSPRTERFFLIQDSKEWPCNQREAQRLASDGTLRPAGRDSHINCVFALSNTSSPKGRQ